MSAGQLALSYTGVFLGAGFVSGQELWQFFACFGAVGLLGFLGTAALFFYVDYAAMRLVLTTGQEDMGRIFTPGDRPVLRGVVTAMQGLLLFGVTVIMIAGAAVLVAQLTGLPAWLGGLVFTAVVSLVALLGMDGLVATFSFVVPLTTSCAVVLGGATLIRGGFQVAPAAGSVSALVPNWVVGFFTYAAYNLFGTICILVPMARRLPDLTTLKRGLAGGSGILILLAWSIIAALVVRPEAGGEELPMAVLAGMLHPALEKGYDLLMGAGMFSAALSSVVALVSQCALHWPAVARRQRTATSLLLLGGWLLSLAGFGNLIGVIYPVFGYAGIPFLMILVRNWLQAKAAANPSGRNEELL